ncbi:glycoside hydrolase family 38 N-terminal domain-containing protein [Singulisphaera acidiphila]|uniref:Glycosyl hydrolases family 38 n=1 Tax=Singulisphaera acidiphila (strain ATCC BAA-1392 / DSM 18658 / VKM B-2454 / MOB10) TaxID=886293 RepID=L0DNJ6_SINAD|nr:glycosyl hydrolase family 38 [Singulisphaera acidiphila]AGA30408.1 glycosyl hydrolases family 38 [Singulisphaera acidiphila DSM 18658]
MSMPSPESAEPQTEAPSPPVPEGGHWSLIALVSHDGVEPPANLSESEALGIWCARSVLWHPALLAQTQMLPRIESIDAPTSPGPRELRVVAAGVLDRLPSGYQTQAEDAGAIVVEGGADRLALVRDLLARINAVAPALDTENEGLITAANDFLALGTARWMLRDLTIAMGHADALDTESLEREVLAGALAWCQGDHPAATNRLRAAFELLTQARERFYPVDAYIVDVCLLDPSTPPGSLTDALKARAPVTFLAPALAVEKLAESDPEAIASVREAITEGWADVVGGSYTESEEPLLPMESVLWQFRRGAEVYRRHLDDRNVETLARRRFSLYPELPQLAKRFGFRFAVHLGFDAGRFPIRPEAKRLWEGPDGTSLETLTRPPLGADRSAQGMFIPWRLATSMKDDHVATLPFVHWPNPVAPWYLDLRRVSAFSPVLARWVTLNDYFHLTDRPYETFRPEHDQYVTPYLAQAVARRDERPISRKAVHARLRARLEALNATRALERAVLGTAPDPQTRAEEVSTLDLETSLETGQVDEVHSALERAIPDAASRLAVAIQGETSEARPGFFVFNPLGVARRAAVLLPDAALDLRPEGPLRAAQFTDEGVWAVVDLPAFGYAWVPRDADLAATPTTPGVLSVRGRLLGNESMAVEIDPTSGGIRSIRTPTEEVARLGQQLVVSGLVASDGSPVSTKMREESFEVEYGGPALVQAISRGVIVDPRDDRRLASFTQRYRLWTGRPILELDVTLNDLDPDWLARSAQADPWAHNLACRWAWPDPNSMLRRTCFFSPEVTEADRPETPDALDISTRRQRTALLFGSLAHHRRHGQRMLDTLLIAGRETERNFRLGVVLDLEHPFHASMDFIAPAPVVPTESGPPRTGPTGWLFQLDNKAVAATRLEPLENTGDNHGWGVVFHLFETAGRPARCRLRLFRNPVWARQTDFHHELVVDLPIEEDSILIDLTPHEMARIEVTLG